MLSKFNSLNKTDKIDFFIKIQGMLLKYHPNSPFIFNKNNIKERLQYAGDLFNKYRGWCFTNENSAILFNYIKIEDVKNPLESIKKYSFQPSAPDYNAIIFDFVVCKEVKNCLEFCRLVYRSEIEWVVFIHKGRPTIYRALDYMKRILNIPMV